MASKKDQMIYKKIERLEVKTLDKLVKKYKVDYSDIEPGAMAMITATAHAVLDGASNTEVLELLLGVQGLAAETLEGLEARRDRPDDDEEEVWD